MQLSNSNVLGACGSIVVEAPCYKLKGRSLETKQVNEFIFQFSFSLQLH
jgi:hypothetical protein